MPRQGGPQQPKIHNAAAAREAALDEQSRTSEAARECLALAYRAMAGAFGLESTMELLEVAQRLTAADCATVRVGVAAWCLGGEVDPNVVSRFLKALEGLQEYRHENADAHAAPNTLVVPYGATDGMGWDSDEVTRFLHEPN
jgi:hypothetical protein